MFDQNRGRERAALVHADQIMELRDLQNRMHEQF